jgi:hypothetical protein
VLVILSRSSSKLIQPISGSKEKDFDKLFSCFQGGRISLASQTQLQPLSTIVATTERLLSDAWGSKVLVSENMVNLRPDVGYSSVYRFSLQERPAGVPESVIVKAKKIRQDQERDANAYRYLFDEWAGLQFLSEVATDLAPRCYAGDTEIGLMVIEDLGEGTGLHHLLLGNDYAAAEEAVVNYAATLGKMHASTIGKREIFERIRRSLGPIVEADYGWIASTFQDTISALDITPVLGTEHDIRELIALQEHPGPFLAYTHGDPCPDNLMVGTAIKLFDFETGSFRHALTEGVYGRLHFPTCWCVNRLPEPIVQRMEHTYRTELAKRCPEANDELLFLRGVAAACVYWTLRDCRWRLARALNEDWDVAGMATSRQRLLFRIAVAAETIEQVGYLEALGATLRETNKKLYTLWPPEAHTMLYYPAFRS